MIQKIPTSDKQIIEMLSAFCQFDCVIEDGICIELSFHNEKSIFGGTLRHHYAKRQIVEQVARLEHLRKLNLRKCKLGQLPDMATRSLEFLDLGSNDLTEVPSWVLKQPLKYLSLGANLLSDVPDLDHLPLETLKLHKNRLTRLPKLGTGIVSLNLFLNDIQDFPEAVLGMQKLEVFTFGLSRLRFLPSLASLANLRWLTLTVCDIEYLPDDIHMLTNLEGLQLAKNRLKCLPNRIGELSVLKNLTLYSNEITRLPYSFYELKLNKLNVSSNPLLQEDQLRVWRTFGNIDFIRV